MFYGMGGIIIGRGKGGEGMLLKKDQLFDALLIIVGNAILAIGVGVFVLPIHLLSGGVAGIAVALEPLFHIDPGIMINVLTVVLFLVGALLLGKKFALNTVLGTIFYPLFLTIVTTVFDEQVTTSLLLSSVYAGVLCGIGIGLVFRTGASTGGMDIPPLIINKYTGISLPTLVMITDGLTVCLGIATYGLEAALIGLISVYLTGIMIDKVLLMGGHDAKNVMIISTHYEEIMSKIYTDLNRGATLIQAMGGYTKEQRPMIMIVVSKKQLPALNRLIHHIDPEAFVVVTDTTEVQGLGFTYQEEL